MLNINLKTKSTILVSAIYILTFCCVYLVFPLFTYQQTMINILLADVAATLLVFFFSMLTKNSSIYDPYWSVVPPIIVLYLINQYPDGNEIRQWVLLILVFLWSIRLTGNWLRSWNGLKHEDWRYTSIAEKTGKWYWPVSFLGIHFMPTIFVFLGCLPMWYSLSGAEPFSLFDGMAALITLMAIITEWTADEQLYRFRKTNNSEGFMKTGLWAISRHPNYFGEITFWLGMFLFSIPATDFNYSLVSWSAVGFICMILLFKFISIPLMEKRNIARKPGYQDYIKNVPALLPSVFKRT